MDLTLDPDPAIQKYLHEGRIAWSSGYKPYRRKMLQWAVGERILGLFREGSPLPPNFGLGLDERIVEYPWVLSRLEPGSGTLLDAGSALNQPFLLEHPRIAQKAIVILTLAPEHQEKRANVSYIYGDLRDTFLRDGAFQAIVCISTIEHIGLDNTMLYTNDARYAEGSLQEYRKVMKEFRRLLAPGGCLLLTVPFGKVENFGWMQQFDAEGIEDIVRAFGRLPDHETLFQYTPEGWVRSDRSGCASCEYFNVHTAKEPALDGAAAARAVACLAWER